LPSITSAVVVDSAENPKILLGSIYAYWAIHIIVDFKITLKVQKKRQRDLLISTKSIIL
jgi:hypothetical protein